MAKRPSITITRKIDFTTDAVVCAAERFCGALHREALDAGDGADHQRHERRLDHADLECIERDRLPAARDRKTVGLDAAIKPAHQAAAIERRHRAQERQDRHAR